MYQYEYPHPAITTDIVLFGFDGHTLHVLLIERGVEPYKGAWALPGGFMRINETAEECARRELHEETGVYEITLEQFHTFSEVNRDPRERVVTIGYVGFVRTGDYRLIAGDDAVAARWFEADMLPPIAFDHANIIEKAREYLREALKNRPIAFKLLDRVFSIADLQRLYEQINGTTYDRRNFARKMTTSGYLRQVDNSEQCDESFDMCCPSMPKTQPSFSYKKALADVMSDDADKMPQPRACIGEESDKCMTLADEIEPSGLRLNKCLPSDAPRPNRAPNLYMFDEDEFESDQKAPPPPSGRRTNPFSL